jgi:hypothetical protein
MSYLDKFKLESVVATAGFNDGANKGFWRIQPRVPKRRRGAGQWIEMGAELRAQAKQLQDEADKDDLADSYEESFIVVSQTVKWDNSWL